MKAIRSLNFYQRGLTEGLLLALLSALLPTRTFADSVSTSAGSITVNENSTLTFSLSSLVSSTDPIASYTIILGPFNGLIIPVGPVGTFEYGPSTYYFGSDGFDYVATDTLGDVSNPSNIHVTVKEVDLPPVVSTGLFSTAAATPLEIPLFTLASPTNGVPIVSYGIGVPSDGTISGFDSTDGTLFYDPNAGFTGLDTFAYSAEAANGKQATGMIDIFVAPPIVATPEPSTFLLVGFGLLGMFARSQKKATT
jgi:hypothetical protein